MGDEPRISGLTADIGLLRSLIAGDIRKSRIAPGRPKLLMLAGLPGSGKSTLAREITAQEPFLVLESDRLRKSLVGQPEYTAGEHRRVFRACHRLIDEFLGKGFPVLLDATNLNQRSRRPVLAIARKHHAPAAVAVVTAPAETVRQRLEVREAGLDPQTWSDAGWEIYSRMAPAWQAVSSDHFLVDTSRDTTAVMDKLLEWARS